MRGKVCVLYLGFILFIVGSAKASPAVPISSDHPWNMAEEFVLLSINGHTGKVSAHADHIEFGLAGTLIAELCRQGALALQQGKVVLGASGPLSEPYLNFCRDMIARAKKTHGLRYWISEIADEGAKLQRMILEELARQEIVSPVSYRPFLGHRRFRYTLREWSHRDDLVRCIQEVVLRGTPTAQEITLGSVLYACDLHKDLFSVKDEYRLARRTLKGWAKSDQIGRSVLHEIGDAQTSDNWVLDQIIMSTIN